MQETGHFEGDSQQRNTYKQIRPIVPRDIALLALRRLCCLRYIKGSVSRGCHSASSHFGLHWKPSWTIAFEMFHILSFVRFFAFFALSQRENRKTRKITFSSIQPLFRTLRRGGVLYSSSSASSLSSKSMQPRVPNTINVNVLVPVPYNKTHSPPSSVWSRYCTTNKPGVVEHDEHFTESQVPIELMDP